MVQCVQMADTMCHLNFHKSDKMVPKCA